MIRDTRQIQFINFEGGLDLETPGLSVQPGRMLSCKNYEIDTLGGYSRVEGYERFDGQPSPSAELLTDVERDDRRADIQKPPGVGPIRGIGILNGQPYVFRDSEDGTKCYLYKSTATGWELVVTPPLAPGGRYDIKTYNFKATADTKVMYGADGVNPAFVFDGDTFDQVTIPNEDRPPVFACAHNNYLFVGIEDGTVYYSAVGDPLNFDPLEDAGVFGAGDTLTGLVPTVGGALAVLMRNRISILYGSSPTEWSKNDLRSHDDQVGAIAHSVLTFNDLYYLDDRGITSLSATQSFGNFQSATFSRGVNPLLRRLRGRFICSLVSRRKNQMRWYFNPVASLSGSEVLTATFVNGQMAGFTRQVLKHKAACAGSGELPNGEEIILLGTDDGWVLRMDIGTSFDGEPIESYFRTAFGHAGQPRRKKSYKGAIFNVQATNRVPLSIKPMFDYNDPQIMAHRIDDLDVIGGGANWDEGEWNEFYWSAQVMSEGRADIQGIARNIALLVYSNTATAGPHTFFDVQLTYSMRGITQ